MALSSFSYTYIRSFQVKFLSTVTYIIYATNIFRIYYVPVSVEIITGLILQRGAKIKAALVDEKLDELSKKKKKGKRKRRGITIRKDMNTMRTSTKKAQCVFFAGGIKFDLWLTRRRLAAIKDEPLYSRGERYLSLPDEQKLIYADVFSIVSHCVTACWIKIQFK